MTKSSQKYTEEKIRVAGEEVSFIKGGSGKPLLILHEELGYPGWLDWHTALAKNRTLYIPLHPGFGSSPRIEWIASIRDLASFYLRVLRDLNLSPIDVVGFSLGGWIAAEMAVSCTHQFGRMILVAPAGIRPPEGEIMDMFVIRARAYLEASVYEPQTTREYEQLYGGSATAEQFENWEEARAEAARLAWQPYMYNPSLGPLLTGVTDVPTLLIWGQQDRIIPVSTATVYSNFVSQSKLVIFDNCGHRPEIEYPTEFLDEVHKFLI